MASGSMPRLPPPAARAICSCCPRGSGAYQRIGVRDRAQAVGWCLSHGLITRQELDRRYRPCPAPAVR